LDKDKGQTFSSLTGLRMERNIGKYVLTIETGGYCRFDEKYPCNGYHKHKNYEVCFVTAGRGIFEHGSHIYELSEGDIFIAEPQIIHEIRTNGMLQLVFITVRIASVNHNSIEDNDEKILENFIKAHDIIGHNKHQLYTYISFIKKYVINGGGNYGVYNALFNFSMECLLSLSCESEYKINYTEKNDIVDQAVRYIGANMTKKVSVKEVSEYVCTSERNLQYIFRKQFAKSVHQYINERKASIAAAYLKMNFNISEAAEKVAIYDDAQFIRFFKRYYGVSPKKYKQCHMATSSVTGDDFIVK
jgi:AraC family transcriptional regulator, transcriptional activator of pobA